MVKISIFILGLAGVGLGGLIQPVVQNTHHLQTVGTQTADHSH